jgi:hypothetical protein
MIYLKLLYAVSFPLLLGVSALNIFLHKRDDALFLERLALGFCLGLMLITLEMAYFLSRFSIRYSVLSISLPFIPLILWGLFVSLKNKLLNFQTNLMSIFSLKPLEKLFLLIILVQILFVFSSSLIKPVVGVDAWANYSLRAKAYFIEGTNQIKTIPPSGRGDHIALTQTWVFTCINQWNDLLGKINFPIYYLCLLIIFYYAVRRIQSQSIALLTTAMLATLPFLVYHATLEYCDLPIAIYLFAGVAFLFRWLENPKIEYLLLAFVFLLSSPTIKNEAYLHLSVVTLVFIFNVFSQKLSHAPAIKTIRAITIVAVILGGAYALRKALLAPELVLLPLTTYLSRIIPLLLVFGEYLFIRSNWNMVWFILVLLIIFNYKKLKENLSLLSLAVLELLGIMFFYLTSTQEVYSWLFYVTPAVRNQLQFMPIVMFLLAKLLNFEDYHVKKLKGRNL